jgi:hypothetical protein
MFCITITCFAQDKIHPYNKMLMRLYPRSFEFKHPEVPRILAADALNIYKNSGNVLFIGCGASTRAVLGGLYFRDCSKIDTEGLKTLLQNNKLLIVY